MNVDANEYVLSKLESVVSEHQKDFGNARYVRNYFEAVIEHQANRLATNADLTAEMISELTLEDVKVDLRQDIQGLSNVGF